MKKMNVLLAMSVAAIFAAQPAMADSTATVNTSSSGSSSGVMEQILKKARANYAVEMFGPSVAALSGNTGGEGTNLTIIHYPAIGYRIGGKWSVMVTQPFQQKIDEKAEGSAGAPRAFEALDPYVSFNNSRIMGSNYLSSNLSGQIRYYVPVSRGTHNNANAAKSTENGGGYIRALLNPSIALMDGALEINAPLYFYYHFNSRNDTERAAANSGSASRRDYRVYPALIVGYQAFKNVQPYLEMGALFTHTTKKSADSWSKIDDPSDGFYLSPGLNINVGKKLSINTAAYVGPYAFDIKKTSLYAAATYVFL